MQRRPQTTAGSFAAAGLRTSFGWGTNLTNDFRGGDPGGGNNLEPVSLMCKVVSANGRPAVKLSDNPQKATRLLADLLPARGRSWPIVLKKSG